MLTKEDKINGFFDPEHWSPMQRSVYADSTKKFNLLSGPVQSGKTHISNIIFGQYVIFESPHTRFLLCGNTVDTVHRNVIDNGFLEYLQMVLGKNNVEYFRGDRIELRIPGQPLNIIWIVGINNKLALDRLKGPPIGGSLLDEFTTYPQEPAMMALARNSLPGSLIFATTNPAAPTHWVFKRFIKGTDKKWAHMTNVFMFQMSDNPTMDDETKEFYENFFTGVFKRRNVYGEWVQAEGAIYDMFEIGKNTYVDEPDWDFDDAYLCVDYGTASVATIAYWGVKTHKNRPPEFYCIDEWYYDAKDEGIRLTDHKIAEKMYNWIRKGFKEYRFKKIPSAVYVDKSAASMIAELEDYVVVVPAGTGEWPGHNVPKPPEGETIMVPVHPFENVTEAPNAVREGIEAMSRVISTGQMKWNQKCKHATEQIESYAWDEKARERDDAKPIKVDDHCPDRDRYGYMGWSDDHGTRVSSQKPSVAGAGYKIMQDRYGG